RESGGIEKREDLADGEVDQDARKTRLVEVACDECPEHGGQVHSGLPAELRADHDRRQHSCRDEAECDPALPIHCQIMKQESWPARSPSSLARRAASVVPQPVPLHELVTASDSSRARWKDSRRPRERRKQQDPRPWSSEVTWPTPKRSSASRPTPRRGSGRSTCGSTTPWSPSSLLSQR